MQGKIRNSNQGAWGFCWSGSWVEDEEAQEIYIERPCPPQPTRNCLSWQWSNKYALDPSIGFFFRKPLAELDASLILRQHFCSRTTALITPVARYLNTLIPNPTEVTQARKSGRTLRLKPFNSASFFTSLKTHGGTLPFRSKTKRTEFYERSLQTLLLSFKISKTFV